jgi:hypothetical protein
VVSFADRKLEEGMVYGDIKITFPEDLLKSTKEFILNYKEILWNVWDEMGIGNWKFSKPYPIQGSKVFLVEYESVQ